MAVPLTVRYERRIPPAKFGREIVTKIDIDQINRLRSLADRGHIDEIVLVGPGTCTGWRMRVDREVRFVKREAESDADRIEQYQAENRVVPAEGWPKS